MLFPAHGCRFFLNGRKTGECVFYFSASGVLLLPLLGCGSFRGLLRSIAVAKRGASRYGRVIGAIAGRFSFPPLKTLVPGIVFSAGLHGGIVSMCKPMRPCEDDATGDASK